MKYSREIKIGILAIICVFLLIFGFNYLKGVNIFSSVRVYHGKFCNVKGLTEQAPVYVRGYKVGLVSSVEYDFTKDTAFVVDVSIDNSIKLPIGTQMAIISDGLLNGTAVELLIPSESPINTYELGDYIPTLNLPSIVEKLEQGLLVHIDSVVISANELLADLRFVVKSGKIKNSLTNINIISDNLKSSSQELKNLMTYKVPKMSMQVDSILSNINIVSDNLSKADIKKTVSKFNNVADKADDILVSANSKESTIGLLLNDKTLYNNINTAVISVDSLLVDLKKNPKRYVHFSLFGNKDKKNKK